MKILIFLSLFFIGCQSISHYDLVRAEWETFKATFKKSYATEAEEQRRMHIFMERKYKVALHNKRYAEGLVSFEAGINSFSDMTHKELVQFTNCFDLSSLDNITNEFTFPPLPEGFKLPDQIDWREKGAVNSVIGDQGWCHSCYGFSAVGALEAQHFLKTGKMVSLSVQNLVDCTREYGNNGCNGGHMHKSFEYIKKNGGIDTEESYPYEGIDTETCRYNPENIGATITNYTWFYKANETLLQQVVATVGPVSVGIYGSLQSFLEFRGKKVYYDPECVERRGNHAVLVVGYGTTEEGEDYWLIKNSWGYWWGDEGYVKLARNRNNQCGVGDYIAYPVV